MQTPAGLLWMRVFSRAGKITGNNTSLAGESVNNRCSQGRRRKSCEKHFIFNSFFGRGKKNNNLKVWGFITIWHRILLTLQRQMRSTICCALLVLYSVICVRGGIGGTGQIVTPWQMRSVYLWNCSQSCKTDLLSTDELEPIQRDTLKITTVQT